MFETVFMEHADGVLRKEIIEGLGDTEEDAADHHSELDDPIDSFTAYDGKVYELRKPRPAKNRNRR